MSETRTTTTKENDATMVNFPPKFGGGGRPRPARHSGGFGDDTWIKSFRDERTVIRPQVEPSLSVSEYLELLTRAGSCPDCEIPAEAAAALHRRAELALADGRVLTQPGVRPEHEWFNPVPTEVNDDGEVLAAVDYRWCEVHNPDNNQFYFTRTHYHEQFWTFPCARYAGLDWCLGEDALSLEKSDQAWIFNALDEEGNLNVYRCGWTVFNQISNFREVGSENHTVTESAFVIVKSNPSGKKTEYSAIARSIRGDYAPIPISGHIRVEGLLYKQYQEVLEKAVKAGIDVPALVPAEEPAPTPKPAPAPTTVGSASPAPAEPTGNGHATPEAEAAVTADPVAADPWDRVSVRLIDMATGELKDLLEANKIAFPKNAVRSKVLELVEKAVREGKLPDF